MTYKALRRKADKEYVTLSVKEGNWILIKSDHPIPFSTPFMLSHPEIDWTLYEIVEVVVIPVDEMPTPAEMNKDADEYYDNVPEDEGKYNADIHFLRGENHVINKLKS